MCIVRKCRVGVKSSQIFTLYFIFDKNFVVNLFFISENKRMAFPVIQEVYTDGGMAYTTQNVNLK